MLTSIEGIYRDGKIELSELPGGVRTQMRVIVMFIGPRELSLSERGIDPAQASKLRDSLAVFAEDWESPEMEAYDDYDSHRVQNP